MSIRKGNSIISGTDTGDGKSITRNSSSQLQTIGVIDQSDNNTALKYWSGTRAEYEAIATKDANTLYNITDDTDVTLSLLEILYPVGAIYIGTMSTCPLAVLGIGTWALKATDRVLQGSGTNNAGSTVEAGLPNITGTFSNFYGESPSGSGAMQLSSSAGSHKGGLTSGWSAGGMTFDASRSSSIYGNSTTVQPPAYIVNIWERIS